MDVCGLADARDVLCALVGLRVIAPLSGYAWLSTAHVRALPQAAHVDANIVTAAVVIRFTDQARRSDATALCFAAQGVVWAWDEGLIGAFQGVGRVGVLASSVCFAELRAVTTAIPVGEARATLTLLPAGARFTDLLGRGAIESVFGVAAEVFHSDRFIGVSSDGDGVAVVFGGVTLTLVAAWVEGAER